MLLRQARLALVLFALAVALPVRALADEVFSLSMPAMPVAEAAKSLSYQTGHSVLFQTDDLGPIQTNAVFGRFTLRRALDALLEGTSLSGGLTQSGVIVISQDKSAQAQGREDAMTTGKIKKTLLASVAAFLFGTGAHAQDAGSNQGDQDFAQQSRAPTDEIVVTAQKRAQRASDVGLTITAKTGEQLQEAGVTDVTLLAYVVPGFSSGQTAFGYPIFSLRGVNFNSSQLSAPPTVSTYVDEAILPYPAMTGGLLLDIERVEVLKGPQGTLFGQNATGGSINIIAAKPTPTLKAGFRTEVNQFGETRLEGYVSGPVSDTLNARLAASTAQFGAWQQSYHIGKPENGAQNKAAVRLLLDWRPADRLKISLNLNGNYDHGEALMPQLAKVIPPAVPGVLGYPFPDDARDTDIDPGYDTHKDTRTYQAVGRIDYEITDNLTFTSLTDYANTHIFTPLNQEGTGIVALQGSGHGEIDAFNQEIRLTGKAPSLGVNYIIGANYTHDKIDDNFVSFNILYSSTPPNTLLEPSWNVISKSAGVFGNLDYEIVEGVTLTGGLRYTDTEQSNVGCTYFNGVCATGADLSGEQKQDNLSWRAGVNFKPSEDALIYGLVSRGYKAGLIPAVFAFAPAQLAPVSQEKLTSYEIGAKLNMLGRRLQFNVSGFYYDYIDKQFLTYTTVPLIGPVNAIVNIPESDVKGFDVELTARPVDGLTLNAALTYVQTKVGAYTGIGAAGNPIDFSGKEFNFAPPVSATVNAEYRAPVSDGLTAVFGANMLYNSRTFADLGENPDTRLPEYATVDLRAGVESDAGWRLGVFVRNVADKYYWTTVFNGGDTLVKMAAPPRTFGIMAGAQF
ncbi:MAG: TonB-dependent receptor [Amphiplicatus sp.]